MQFDRRLWRHFAVEVSCLNAAVSTSENRRKFNSAVEADMANEDDCSSDMIINFDVSEWITLGSALELFLFVMQHFGLFERLQVLALKGFAAAAAD